MFIPHPGHYDSWGINWGLHAFSFWEERQGCPSCRKAASRRCFKPEKIRRVRAYFRKYGDKLVFFARFVAGFRPVVFLYGGSHENEIPPFPLVRRCGSSCECSYL